MRWKRGREGSLTDVEQFPEWKAVASIRARERLSLFTKKLSGKYMEKVIWSVCKNSSTFPFSSHSFTVWKLPSEETVLREWQQEETEQSGWEALQGAEISFFFVSVGIPAGLHPREVGILLGWLLGPSALPLGYTHLQQGLLWEIQGIKKIQLASFSLKKYGMDEVALTRERFLPILTIFQCT